MDKIIAAIAGEFKQTNEHAENIVKLLDEGNTVPFIARYRKEMTGGVDDQVLRELSERLTYLRSLAARKDEIKTLIDTQGKLTEELSSAIDSAVTLSELDDIYRPYRPKRRTRATIAKEKGLEPLADIIFAQEKLNVSLEELAATFINEEKGVTDITDALNGAKDIIAENISDDAQVRRLLKNYIFRNGIISSLATKLEESVYEQYYDYSEPICKITSHRILAINRAEKEGFVKVGIAANEKDALQLISSRVVKKDEITSSVVTEAAKDAYTRLIFPSIERELRNSLTESADEQAIRTFALNLKPLLLQRPVKNTVVLGFDPAFRTGCKLAVVDGTGKVLKTDVIYPTAPHNKIAESATKLKNLIALYNVGVISLGNGTASRESEKFIADTIKGTDCAYLIVNEAGASVYSASKLAAKEFPDYDVSLRSAVSIARRLEDPLSELVKIDPKSIGVGQYQHDMPQARLDETLGKAVEDCVNMVGADLNTASASLLSYISGINAAISTNIVKYREENGMFSSRKELLKVPKLGDKTYQQCAGFLRVPESKNILDNTSVHPESYDAAEKLLKLCGFSLNDVKNGKVEGIASVAENIGYNKLATECNIGIPTIKDIIFSLLKPGRDPRDEFAPVELRSDVMSIADLSEGMILTGTVRNVVDFGAFVDIGVHQDGLVHISQISDKFIKHPSDKVKTGDIVKVKVLEVNQQKNRISLTMLV